jgi:two-component system, response regulator
MLNSIDILLVEDNASDAELTIRALKRNNLANNLLHIKDGKEALDFVFAREKYENVRDVMHPPRIVLLDIQMPKVNGMEVLEKIKADPRTKAIPVVMLTSSKESPDIKKSYALGANSYIVKPVSFENFSEAITALGFYWLVINQIPR